MKVTWLQTQADFRGIWSGESIFSDGLGGGER